MILSFWFPKIIRLIKKLTHPVFVFVGLQIVWIAFVVLWVFWFITQKENLSTVSQMMGESPIISGTTAIVILIVGSILLGIILVGTIVLFAFTQIQSSLIRQQNSFVSSVTHELRSPLASIQLSFETMQRANLPEDVQTKLYAMVNADIERLTTLIDRILIASRLDKGIVDLSSNIEVFNFLDVLEKAVEQNSHLDRSVTDRIDLNCPDDLNLRSNRLAFNLIFGNLIENSIKYSPNDSLINVIVTRSAHHIHCEINDSGVGLTKREQKRIFDMFHRSPRATKQAIPGTGIGLYIVKSMIRALGGRVWAKSQGLGKGSSFHILLPISLATTIQPLYQYQNGDRML